VNCKFVLDIEKPLSALSDIEDRKLRFRKLFEIRKIGALQLSVTLGFTQVDISSI